MYLMPTNHVHRYVQIGKSSSIVLHFISGMDLLFMFDRAKIYKFFMRIRMVQNLKASGVEIEKFQDK